MEDTKKIIEQLAHHDEKIKSMDVRLKNCEETTSAINSLTQSIAKMDVTLENTNETVKDLKNDVHELKEKPSKRLDTTITAIISALAGGAISFIISALLQ